MAYTYFSRNLIRDCCIARLVFILSRYDYVTVYDGVGSSAPMIGEKLCGGTLPQAIQSTGNTLKLKFIHVFDA